MFGCKVIVIVGENVFPVEGGLAEVAVVGVAIAFIAFLATSFGRPIIVLHYRGHGGAGTAGYEFAPIVLVVFIEIAVEGRRLREDGCFEKFRRILCRAVFE